MHYDNEFSITVAVFDDDRLPMKREREHHFMYRKNHCQSDLRCLARTVCDIDAFIYTYEILTKRWGYVAWHWALVESKIEWRTREKYRRIQFDAFRCVLFTKPNHIAFSAVWVLTDIFTVSIYLKKKKKKQWLNNHFRFVSLVKQQKLPLYCYCSRIFFGSWSRK